MRCHISLYAKALSARFRDKGYLLSGMKFASFTVTALKGGKKKCKA